MSYRRAHFSLLFLLHLHQRFRHTFSLCALLYKETSQTRSTCGSNNFSQATGEGIRQLDYGIAFSSVSLCETTFPSL
jgi:hypothetical protein